ncbi:MAG: T9SS type A sorting domain-containing protein [Bacteroidales bacterium]|nr:T9SS type A sorting domain-containing protein [Bacteroidales bacterium]MCF8339173.1 T9SS type A sorting domain-containing protein [Bacteroidales bacterium]
MYVKYRTIFGATDFTYDGTHFWMADTVANKIRKMEAVDIIGYERMALNNNLSVFPNPAEDYIRIESGDVQPEGFLKIFDVNGELIRKVRAVTYRSTQRINVSALPSGVYVITLERENGKYAGRFVKR